MSERTLDPLGIIDTHVHFWDITLPSQVWPTPEWTPLYRSFHLEDFAQAAASAGVTSAVFIEAGTSDESARFMEKTAQSDLIAGIAPYIDLTSPTLAADLDRWIQNKKVKTVRARIEGIADPNILLEPTVLEGLRQVAARGLGYEFLINSYHLASILRVYENIPNLKGIVEHLGKPDVRYGSDRSAWTRDMQNLAANTPVTCKLSLGARLEDLDQLLARQQEGWHSEQIKPYVQLLLEKFGPARLMWGSDWPLILMESDYKGTLDAMRQALGPLSADDESAIFSTSARKFYNLPL